MEVIRIDVPMGDSRRPLREYRDQDWASDVADPLIFGIEEAQEAIITLLGGQGGSVLFRVPAGISPGWRMVASGLYGLARSIAKEYGRRNIRCNTLVGNSVECDRLLTQNSGITGELVIAGTTIVALGFDKQ